MKFIKSKKIFLGLVAFLPVITFAFSLEGSTFGGIIDEIVSILNILTPIMTAIAVIFFFWGLSKFILNSGNQADLDKGKKYMFWGVLALFILITYRTIIGFVANDLGIGGSSGLPYLNNDAQTPTNGPAGQMGCTPPATYDQISGRCM